MDLFGDVKPFPEEVTVSPATIEKLLSVLQNPHEKKLGASCNNRCRYAICEGNIQLRRGRSISTHLL